MAALGGRHTVEQVTDCRSHAGAWEREWEVHGNPVNPFIRLIWF